MTEAETIEVDGVELDIEDTLEAIEEIEGEYGYTYGNRAIVGSVMAEGDGFSDGDTYFYNVSDLEKVTEDEVEAVDKAYQSISTVKDIVDGAQPFKDFVEENFSVEVLDDSAYTMEPGIDVTTTQSRPTLGSAVGRSISESDDVSIGYVCVGDDGRGGGEGRLRINLRDER